MNNKTSKEKLLEEIQEDFIIYLKSGVLSNKVFELKNIDLNIEKQGLNKLLDIHFLLSKEVNNFVKELKNLLRKFNTSTRKHESLTRGQIKGAISWSKTLQARNSINPKDKTIFVCNENYKNFDTKENIVLKIFLDKIYSIIESINFKSYEEYEWFTDIKDMKKILESIYLKNIYLSRIDISNFKLHNRILEDVSRNRNPLYNKAANLLKSYKKLKELNYNTIKELLKNTFIKLTNEATLFELYWVLKIIKDNTDNKKLYILEKGNNKLAEWHDNTMIYTIYHNCTGSNDINFTIKSEDIKTEDIQNINKNFTQEFLKRKVEIIKTTEKFSKSIGQDPNKNMRPDIIIEVREIDTKKLKKIIIGEVKYTLDKDYAIYGFKQLSEYCKFVRCGKDLDFISNEIEIEGLLFLDNIDINKNQYENIRIITINDKAKKINISQ